MREVWLGRVWSVRTVRIVRDTPELLAYYVGPGTLWLPPVDEAGTIIRIPTQEWRLGEDIGWENHVLHLLVPGEEHSVLLIWNEDWDLQRWYNNIEQPHVRTPIGFDYMDWTLDLVVAPDFSRWHWKDEEELEEAVSLGSYTREHADRMRKEGEAALARLLRRDPPLDERWEDWRADPAWPLPALPKSWLLPGEK